MKYIENFFNQVKYFFEQSQFTSQELLLLAVIGLICLYIILWIPARGMKLWYWKTNKQLEVLKKIDEKLDSLKDYKKDCKAEEKSDAQATADVLQPLEESKSQEETVIPQEAEEQMVSSKPEVTAIPRYNIGKSGKVYSIEEIESIIKD